MIYDGRSRDVGKKARCQQQALNTTWLLHSTYNETEHYYTYFYILKRIVTDARGVWQTVKTNLETTN